MKFLLALLIASPTLHALQAAAPREVTAERIAAAFQDVRAAVKDVLSLDVDPKFEPRLVVAKDIAARVAEENLPVVLLRQPDLELARTEADLLGQNLAQSALAKYTWTTKELLVSSKIWRRQAAMMNRPELTSDEALRAVLVHEVVHALDDARHDIGKVIARLGSVDAVQGFNGVLEGHAQLLARRVCEKRGWKSGFDVFSANIGGVPEGVDTLAAAQADMLRAQGAVAASPYVAGETFMGAVEARGPEAVARSFREPPDTPDLLYRPDWWLAPATRPKSKYPIDAALTDVETRYPTEEWVATKLTLPRAGIEAAMARIGTERVKSALDGRVTSKSITLQPRAAPDSKLVSVSFHEFVDEKSREHFREAGTALGRARDEDMRRPDASVRLAELKSEPMEGDGWTGTLEVRRLEAPGHEIVASSARVATKELVLEVVFSNEPITSAELKALVNTLVAKSKGK